MGQLHTWLYAASVHQIQKWIRNRTQGSSDISGDTSTVIIYPSEHSGELLKQAGTYHQQFNAISFHSQLQCTPQWIAKKPV